MRIKVRKSVGDFRFSLEKSSVLFREFKDRDLIRKLLFKCDTIGEKIYRISELCYNIFKFKEIKKKVEKLEYEAFYLLKMM